MIPEKGLPGEKGIDGDQGQKGLPGDKGGPGAKGDKGDKGEPDRSELEAKEPSIKGPPQALVHHSGNFDFTGPTPLKISKNTFLSCGEEKNLNGMPCIDRAFNQFAWLKIVPKVDQCFPPTVSVPKAVWTPCYWYRAPNPFTSKAIKIENTSGEATFSFESPSSIQGLSELFKSDDNPDKKTVVCSDINLLISDPNEYSVGFRYIVTISLLQHPDQDHLDLWGLRQYQKSRSWVLQADKNSLIFPNGSQEGESFTLTWNDDHVSE